MWHITRRRLAKWKPIVFAQNVHGDLETDIPLFSLSFGVINHSLNNDHVNREIFLAHELRMTAKKIDGCTVWMDDVASLRRLVHSIQCSID